MYNIKILKTAHIDCTDSVIYKNGDSGSVTTIGCHCFLLYDNDKYYLIDTGIEDIDVVNRTKSSKADWTRSGDEHTVKEQLGLLGIDCNKITKVFITHAHYDHISGIKHFKNAVFYMTKTEYEELYSESNKQKDVLGEVKEFLSASDTKVFDDELVTDGIKLKLRGGHTKGSMSVETDNILFTGDTIFVQDNIRKKIPAGFTEEREVSDRLLDEYLVYPGKIVTSHDINEVI